MGTSALCVREAWEWEVGARLRQPYLLPSWLKATNPTLPLRHAGRFPCPHRGGPQHSTVHSGVHAGAPSAKRRRVCTRSTRSAPAPQVDCVFTHAKMPHAAWSVRKYKCICMWTHTPPGCLAGHADLQTHTRGVTAPAGSSALLPQPCGSSGRGAARAQVGLGLGRPPSGRRPDYPSGPRCHPALAAA